MMQQTRFLFPFTEHIDLEAVTYAVQFASSRQATLVTLALLPSEHQGAKGPRLEAIEQANDFLQVVAYQAKRAGVPFELSMRETRDIVCSIRLFAQEFLCEGVLLFLRGGTTLFLSVDTVRVLTEQNFCPIFLVRLCPPVKVGPVPTLRAWCFDLMNQRIRQLRKTPSSRYAHVVPKGEVLTLFPAQWTPAQLVQTKEERHHDHTGV